MPPGPSQPSGLGLASKVGAAPFVPSSAAPVKSGGAAGSAFSAAAQPFVPGNSPTKPATGAAASGPPAGSQPAPAAAGGRGSGAAGGAKLAVNAVAFVPNKQQADAGPGKGGRWASGAEAPAGSSDGPSASTPSAAAAPVAGGGSSSGGAGRGTAAPSTPSSSTPAAGRSGPGGRGPGSAGGRGGAGGASGMPSGPAGRSPPGPAAGGPMPGRGGPGGRGPGGPGPMQGRGGRGNRGSGFMGPPGMGLPPHHPAGAMGAMGMGVGMGMMGPAGFVPGGPMGVGPMMAHNPMASYGSGGGGHLPTYRSRDPYLVGPGRAYVGLHFAEEGLRQHLQQRSYLTAAQWHPDEASGLEPSTPAPALRLGPYHTLYPLEEGALGGGAAGAGAGGDLMPSAALGLRTVLLKGVSSVDGSAAALRRVDPKQVIPTAELLSHCREAVESWAPLANHPNLVGLRAAFLASDVLPSGPQPAAGSGAAGGGGGAQGGGGGGGGSQPGSATAAAAAAAAAGGAEGASALVFAHDYHPGAVSLAQAHLVPQMTPAGLVSAPQPPPEDVIWSYAVQLTSALRAAHGCGLLLRPACLHPTKVLLTGMGRLRVGSVGILDALMGAEQPGPEEMQMLMRQDISAVGSLLLTLCCAGSGPAPSLELVAAHGYSPELARLLGAALSAVEGGPLGSWRGLVAALADRAFTELDGANVGVDHLMVELGKEVENGRLLRLLAKINFVVERPAGEGAGMGAGADGDSSWSETGDRYCVKLFRDFAFHGAHPDTGGPLLDWGCIVEALNKLDAGVHEELLLLGRDGQSMLVVTYADVKRCLESAFSELRAAAHAAGAGTGPGGRGGPQRPGVRM